MSLVATSFVTPTPTSTPVPVGPGDWCNQPLTLTCGGCVEGTTVGAGNHFDTNDTCSAYIENFEGPDIVYELVLNDVYSVTFLGQADYDADWAIVQACDAGSTDPIICFDNTTVTTTPSCSSIDPGDVDEYGDLQYEIILGPGTFYVWVDGFTTEDSGNYALEVICGSIPASLECDAGSIWEQPGNSGTAFLSDEFYPFYGAEQFSGVFSIENIRWWGIETTPGAPCTRDDPVFHITLYQNNGGLPGTVAWQGDITPDSRVNSGEVFGVHGPIWVYDATLPAPVRSHRRMDRNPRSGVDNMRIRLDWSCCRRLSACQFCRWDSMGCRGKWIGDVYWWNSACHSDTAPDPRDWSGRNRHPHFRDQRNSRTIPFSG